MKQFGWMLVLLMLAVPAWAAKKMTVGELEDLLHSLQQAKTTDAEIANQLKQVELSEQLPRAAMNALVARVPGPQSTAQLYAIEAESAMLAPPAADLPAAPAPDAATQRAILALAETYVTKTYRQLPPLKATKVILRFQDNMEALSAGSGIVGHATEADTSSGLSNQAQFIRFMNSAYVPVASEHGAEKPSSEKDKTPWGANKMIALKEPDPSLGSVFPEAQAAAPQWLRWELVNGKKTAVFSFAAPGKTSPLAVNVCCFPNLTQTGVARFYTPLTAGMVAGPEAAGGGAGGVTGNFQTSTDWHEFKASVPYHGEIFIDPDTGIVVRMITKAELKPTEVAHRVDTRIDYGPVTIAGKTHIVPVRTYIDTLVVPNGDSGAGGYSVRRTLFSATYQSYQ